MAHRYHFAAPYGYLCYVPPHIADHDDGRRDVHIRASLVARGESPHFEQYFEAVPFEDDWVALVRKVTDDDEILAHIDDERQEAVYHNGFRWRLQSLERLGTPQRWEVVPPGDGVAHVPQRAWNRQWPEHGYLVYIPPRFARTQDARQRYFAVILQMYHDPQTAREFHEVRSFNEPNWYPMLRAKTLNGISSLHGVDERRGCAFYHDNERNAFDTIPLSRLTREASESLEGM